MGQTALRLADVYQNQSDEHPFFAPLKSASKLDAETFGKLIVFTWAAKNGRSDLPDRDRIIGELLAHRESLSEAGRNVLHPEPRVLGGPTIAEYSDYMAAAQDAGLIRRYNPSYIRCSVEIGKLEAADRLNEYRARFEDVVDWIKDRVDTLSSR